MRNLTLNEANSISGSVGIFTELGSLTGVATWAKVATGHTLHTLRTTGCLPSISRNAAMGGLMIFTGAGAAIGLAVDEAVNTVSSLFNLKIQG